MSKVRITQIKSASGQTARQRANLQALGIKKMHNPIEKTLTPQIAGIIAKVQHLVKVENI
jgi:large subunit ribosomal protein L30